MGVLISKEHTVDLIGKDSPGVGCYDASADQIYKYIKKGSPNRGVKFGTASRFNSVIKSHKKNMPSIPSLNHESIRQVYGDSNSEE